MQNRLVFGSPILLKKLTREYGAKPAPKATDNKRTGDISDFLKHKREMEKKTAASKIIFG